jgi:hypothetical protein
MTGNGGTGVTTKWYDAISAAAQAQPWSGNDLFVDCGMPSLAGPFIVTDPSGILAKLSPQKAEEQVRATFARSFGEVRRDVTL